MGTLSECQAQIFSGLERSPDANPIQLSNPTVQAMAGSFGFAYGQAATISEARRQHPSLGAELELRQMDFEQRFAPSVQVIDSVLSSLGPEWAQQREQIRRQLDERAAAQIISVPEVEQLLEVVGRRTAGRADIAYVQTLLAYHPRYRASPADELTDGFRQLYVSDGTEGGGGIRVRLHVPVSWAGRAGERPNIVQVFTSEAGRGLESFLIQVRQLDPAQHEGASVEEIVGDPTLAEQLLAGSGFTKLCAERTMLDGLPAQAIYMRGTMASPAVELDQIAVAYVTVVANRLVSLHGMVAGETGTGDALLRRFRVFTPAFGLMGASVVFEDRW